MTCYMQSSPHFIPYTKVKIPDGLRDRKIQNSMSEIQLAPELENSYLKKKKKKFGNNPGKLNMKNTLYNIIELK